ncbi:hypothetical protein [Carnimonas bestiolae]|uniref:hypothetical protein n=1 Tax=Carnimonas bestiolae TaxID=3402172 RepID=UPI003EDC053E
MTVAAKRLDRSTLNRIQRAGMTQVKTWATSEGPLQRPAAEEYVKRLTEIELERRMVHRHVNSAWKGISPTAMLGMPDYRDGKRKDDMYQAYVHGIRNDPWENEARAVFAKLPLRRQVALLIQSAKMDDRIAGSEWARTYSAIAVNIDHYLRLLGFEAVGDSLNLNTESAIKDTAKNAKKKLVEMIMR